MLANKVQEVDPCGIPAFVWTNEGMLQSWLSSGQQGLALVNTQQRRMFQTANEVTVEIINRTGKDVSWFCFNSKDTLKLIALGSGNLSANGDSKSYNPPDNASDLYFVRFTEKGGGSELAGGTLKRSGQAIVLEGGDGRYFSAEVKQI